jgi:hypothetical protein
MYNIFQANSAYVKLTEISRKRSNEKLQKKLGYSVYIVFKVLFIIRLIKIFVSHTLSALLYVALGPFKCCMALKLVFGSYHSMIEILYHSI